jgi:hypothetical protein
MSFMTRVRMAIVKWWIRNASERRAPVFEDLEGMGRKLARSPLLFVAHEEDSPSDLPTPEDSVVRRRAAFPKRLQIRFD